MPKSKVVQEVMDEAEEWELQLPVSMIDVTFLLLIFFICTAKFKGLEQRLDAQLPKEGGPTIDPERIDRVEEIRVKIALKDKDRPASGVRMLVNSFPVGGLNELARKLQELRRTMSGIPVIIDGRQNVPFRWILGAVDACARARVADVRFQAPPAEGGGPFDGAQGRPEQEPRGGRWWYE